MKYKFAPMVMIYVGNAMLACLIIAFFSERLNGDSQVQTSESAWIFFQSNIRLACILAILGFMGLLIELQFMLSTMHVSSEN